MTQWRKSSHSGTATDEACVEVARLSSAIGLRDSKHPDWPHLEVERPAFADLLVRVKGAKLDL